MRTNSMTPNQKAREMARKAIDAIDLHITSNPAAKTEEEAKNILATVILSTIPLEELVGALERADKRIEAASSMFVDREWNLGCADDLKATRTALSKLQQKESK